MSCVLQIPETVNGTTDPNSGSNPNNNTNSGNNGGGNNGGGGGGAAAMMTYSLLVMALGLLTILFV